jgi:protein phosphatase
VTGWRSGARTDVGLVRDGNEDSLYAGPRLLAVADGIGGAAAGEIASKIAIDVLAGLDSDSDISDPVAALRGAARQADDAIRDAISRDPQLAGMGTTLTAILWAGDKVALAQLGDSRAYLLRGGEMSQLTHDQTLVQSLVDEGEITAEEAMVHPRRSWILRALDGRGEAEPDIQPLTPVPGDRYLLCSDGLSDYVDQSAIAAALTAGEDPQLACNQLVELALAAGAPDNVTCIVAEPVEGDPPTTRPVVGGAASSRSAPRPVADTGSDAPPAQPRSIGKRLALVAAAVVVLVIAAGAGTVLYIRGQWYVAAAQGNVGVYRGVAGSAAGISLHRLEQRSDLPASALPQDDRDRLANGITAGSRAQAYAVLANLRSEACALTPSAPANNPSQTPTASPHRIARHRHTVARQPVHATPSPPPSWCTSPVTASPTPTS